MLLQQLLKLLVRQKVELQLLLHLLQLQQIEFRLLAGFFQLAFQARVLGGQSLWITGRGRRSGSSGRA